MLLGLRGFPRDPSSVVSCHRLAVLNHSVRRCLLSVCVCVYKVSCYFSGSLRLWFPLRRIRNPIQILLPFVFRADRHTPGPAIRVLRALLVTSYEQGGGPDPTIPA